MSKGQTKNMELPDHDKCTEQYLVKNFTINNEVVNFYLLANEMIIFSFEYIILSKVLHASL